MAAADLQNWVPAIELKLKSLTKTKTIELTVLPSLCFQAGCLIHFTAEKLGMQCQIVSDAEINNLTASQAIQLWTAATHSETCWVQYNIYSGSFTSWSKVL